MTKDEALSLALEALRDLLDQTETPPDRNCSCHIAPPCHDCVDYGGVRYAIKQANEAITTAKEALAQPEEQQSCDKQEPVVCQYAIDVAMPEYRCVGKCQYTPPPRPWVGLTDAERDSVLDSVPPDNLGGEYYDKEITAIAIAIEAKLKEKNT